MADREWVPSPPRGYSWPPFAPGHELSVRHGAYSARKVEPVASELVEGLLADRPELGAYPDVVWAWARAEARCWLFAAFEAENGLFDGEGRPRKHLVDAARFERLASELRGRLGLDPRAESELAKSRADALLGAFDVDAVKARGREVLDAHESSGAIEAAGEAES